MSTQPGSVAKDKGIRREAQPLLGHTSEDHPGDSVNRHLLSASPADGETVQLDALALPLVGAPTPTLSSRSGIPPHVTLISASPRKPLMTNQTILTNNTNGGDKESYAVSHLAEGPPNQQQQQHQHEQQAHQQQQQQQQAAGPVLTDRYKRSKSMMTRDTVSPVFSLANRYITHSSGSGTFGPSLTKGGRRLAGRGNGAGGKWDTGNSGNNRVNDIGRRQGRDPSTFSETSSIIYEGVGAGVGAGVEVGVGVGMGLGGGIGGIGTPTLSAQLSDQQRQLSRVYSEVDDDDDDDDDEVGDRDESTGKGRRRYAGALDEEDEDEDEVEDDDEGDRDDEDEDDDGKKKKKRRRASIAEEGESDLEEDEDDDDVVDSEDNEDGDGEIEDEDGDGEGEGDRSKKADTESLIQRRIPVDAGAYSLNGTNVYDGSLLGNSLLNTNDGYIGSDHINTNGNMNMYTMRAAPVTLPDVGQCIDMNFVYLKRDNIWWRVCPRWFFTCCFRKAKLTNAVLHVDTRDKDHYKRSKRPVSNIAGPVDNASLPNLLHPPTTYSHVPLLQSAPPTSLVNHLDKNLTSSSSSSNNDGSPSSSNTQRGGSRTSHGGSLLPEWETIPETDIPYTPQENEGVESSERGASSTFTSSYTSSLSSSLSSALSGYSSSSSSSSSAVVAPPLITNSSLPGTNLYDSRQNKTTNTGPTTPLQSNVGIPSHRNYGSMENVDEAIPKDNDASTINAKGHPNGVDKANVSVSQDNSDNGAKKPHPKKKSKKSKKPKKDDMRVFRLVFLCGITAFAGVFNNLMFVKMGLAMPGYPAFLLYFTTLLYVIIYFGWLWLRLHRLRNEAKEAQRKLDEADVLEQAIAGYGPLYAHVGQLTATGSGGGEGESGGGSGGGSDSSGGKMAHNDSFAVSILPSKSTSLADPPKAITDTTKLLHSSTTPPLSLNAKPLSKRDRAKLMKQAIPPANPLTSLFTTRLGIIYIIVGVLITFGGACSQFADPHVTGSMQSLINQLTLPMTAVAANVLLNHKFTRIEIIGAGTVMIGSALPLIPLLFAPSLEISQVGSAVNTPFWVLIFLLSDIPSALVNVVEEIAFSKPYKADEIHYLAFTNFITLFGYLGMIPLDKANPGQDPALAHLSMWEMQANAFRCFFGMEIDYSTYPNPPATTHSPTLLSLGPLPNAATSSSSATPLYTQGFSTSPSSASSSSSAFNPLSMSSALPFLVHGYTLFKSSSASSIASSPLVSPTSDAVRLSLASSPSITGLPPACAPNAWLPVVGFVLCIVVYFYVSAVVVKHESAAFQALASTLVTPLSAVAFSSVAIMGHHAQPLDLLTVLAIIIVPAGIVIYKWEDVAGEGKEEEIIPLIARH